MADTSYPQIVLSRPGIIWNLKVLVGTSKDHVVDTERIKRVDNVQNTTGEKGGLVNGTGGRRGG